MHRCTEIRESLSARADGEVAPVGDRDVRAHLDDCPACTAFAADLASMSRRVRVAAAEPVPDLTASILRRVADEGLRARGDRRRDLRVLVALAGLVQLVLGLTVLLGLAGHLARDLGAFEVALAAGLLVAAWQPTRASGLLPMAATVAGLVVLTSVLDLVGGRVTLPGELAHLGELLGVAALWALSRHTGSGPSRAPRPRTVEA